MGSQMGSQMGSHFKPSKLLKESLKKKIAEAQNKFLFRCHGGPRGPKQRRTPQNSQREYNYPSRSCSAVMEAPEARNNAIRPRTPRENIITPPVPVPLSWRPQRPENRQKKSCLLVGSKYCCTFATFTW